jgi:hypothetical protein
MGENRERTIVGDAAGRHRAPISENANFLSDIINFTLFTTMNRWRLLG